MNNEHFYQNLADRFRKLVEDNGLMGEQVVITGRTLSVEEAIGQPERTDFPIVKGKEKLLEADFRGAKGQAYTDMPNHFKGSLQEIVEMPLQTNFDFAVYIATLNAVCKYLGIIGQTIHCKDDEPEICAKELVSHVKSEYGNPKIALIGYQPAMLEQLAKSFSVRIVDLAEENIGKTVHNVKVEDGNEAVDDLLNWCDLIIATGSTIANKSITNFMIDKPAIFFGTTVAGAAALMNLERFCACAK